MSTHGECGTPQFNPTKLHGLCHFFNNLNFQFVQAQVVNEVEMSGHALRFVDCNTAELWEILPEFTNVTADEPPHQIHSYTLLFSLFLCFLYIADPPLRTSTLMRSCSHNNRTHFIRPILLI